MKRFLQSSLLASFLIPAIHAQQIQLHSDKPEPLKISNAILAIDDGVIRNHWAFAQKLVNVPAELTRIEAGQCVRFGIFASGDGRDAALISAQIELELTYGADQKRIAAQPPQILRRLKPDGGDFVLQALGAAGVEAPDISMASLGVSEMKWCAPEKITNKTLVVKGSIAPKTGKRIELKPLRLEVVSYETAREKKPVKDLNSLSEWIQKYHHAPDPSGILPAMRLAAFDNADSSSLSTMTFFIAALRNSPIAANEIISILPDDRRSMRLYSLPLLKAAGYDVQKVVDGLDANDKAILAVTVIPDPYDLRPDKHLPERMDMMWSIFFATGEAKPVKSIVSLLGWREDYDKFDAMRRSGEKPKELTDSIMRAVSYMAAGWSLSALSRQDGAVADYLETIKESADTPEQIKKELTNLYTNPAFRRQ